MEKTKTFELTHLECSLIKEALRMRVKALKATLNDPDYDKEGVQEGIDTVNNIIESLAEFDRDTPYEDTLLKTKYYLSIGLVQIIKEEL